MLIGSCPIGPNRGSADRQGGLVVIAPFLFLNNLPLPNQHRLIVPEINLIVADRRSGRWRGFRCSLSSGLVAFQLGNSI
jgi:hypothetical protein